MQANQLTTPAMPKDINLHSFNGPDWNGATHEQRELIEPGPEISDTLKFTSRLSGFTAQFGHIVGGYEDCVDVNNHSKSLRIHADLWEPRGKYLATIKGGSREIHLSGRVRGHGREVDIDIGNISDQSDNPTGPVSLDLVHENGDPITVRVINGQRPVFLNGDVQQYKVVLKVPTFWAKLFAKLVALFR